MLAKLGQVTAEINIETICFLSFQICSDYQRSTVEEARDLVNLLNKPHMRVGIANLARLGRSFYIRISHQTFCGPPTL